MQDYMGMMKLAGARFAVFDLGRSCVEVSKKTFAEVISGSAPYEHPFMGKAMLLVVSDVGDTQRAVECFNFDAIELPLDRRHHVQAGAMESYTRAMLADRMGNMDVCLSGRGLWGIGPRTPFSWMPTWGEAFMAQAHFGRKFGGPAANERVDRAAEALLSRRIEAEVGEDFSWSSDVGVPELGLGELIVRAREEERLGKALAAAIQKASLPILGSLCEFMGHAEPPKCVIDAVGIRSREVMKSIKPGDSIYAQLVQSLAGSKDHDAMAPIINAILDHKVGGNAEILTRVVRYHREFMADCDLFELDKLLEPASRKPSGMDVLLAYVVDMIGVKRLHRRLLMDFGNLSPGVKARLREAMMQG